MRGYTERQSLIRDLFLVVVWMEHTEVDDMVDRALFRIKLPSEAELFFPRNKIIKILYDNLLSDCALLEEQICLILSARYLHPRQTPICRDSFDLAKLFHLRNHEFRQAARTTKTGFIHLLREICMNPVFHKGGIRPQLPIAHQLALTLERLGSNGNGASVGRFSRNLSVGRGTVIKVSRRVIRAIVSIGRLHVIWLDATRRAEISDVMKGEGFSGCVGFVDGTTIPLFQRPGYNGKVFYDRKRRYSINAQIVCDCDKYITSFITGWPGSCGDSRVYKRMQLHLNPSQYFDPGQYLLADSAYELTPTVIPAYKAPAVNIPINSEFNFCLAKSRVRNQHTIGILKARWASLKEMRLHLYRPSDMREYVSWLYACIILHNMLAGLGDQWSEMYEEDNGNNGASAMPPSNHDQDAEGFQANLTQECVSLNYKKGVLPM